MEQYQYSRIAWAGSLHPADSCSGCVGTAAGVSVQYYQWIIHAGGGAVYLKASGESSFSGLEMLFLTLTRLLIFPLLMIGFLRLLPIDLDETLKNVLILTAALPVSSAQSMITEQYGTNTAAAGDRCL